MQFYLARVAHSQRAFLESVNIRGTATAYCHEPSVNSIEPQVALVAQEKVPL
jgi:hypothetical protein